MWVWKEAYVSWRRASFCGNQAIQVARNDGLRAIIRMQFSRKVCRHCWNFTGSLSTDCALNFDQADLPKPALDNTLSESERVSGATVLLDEFVVQSLSMTLARTMLSDHTISLFCSVKHVPISFRCIFHFTPSI